MSAALSTRIRASSNGLFERSVDAARPFTRPLTACFSELGVRHAATSRQKDGNGTTQRNPRFFDQRHLSFSPKPLSLKLFASSRRIDAGEIAQLLSSNGVGKQIPAALPVRSLAEDTRREK
jgi:hypothetical protein